MNTNTDFADWTDYSRLKKADHYYNVGKIQIKDKGLGNNI